MQPPIIFSNRGDLLFFRSVSDAEAYLEPIDVEQEEYVAFDSQGARLSLKVVKREHSTLAGLWRFPVSCVAVRESPGERQEQELRRLLVDFLERLGEKRSRLDLLDLSALLDLGIRRGGFS
jgi:hypothetical protein